MAVVITGATRGHGAVLAQEMMLRGYRVLMTGRGEEAAEKCKVLLDEAAAELVYRRENSGRDTGFTDPDSIGLPHELDAGFHELDIACDKSIRKFVTHVRNELSDVPIKLVNNAAEDYPGWTEESISKAIHNNTFGTIKLTESLLPLLGPGSQVFNILCRQAKPRPGSALSMKLNKEIFAMSRLTPTQFIGELRKYKPDLDDPHMRGMPSHQTLMLSKSLLYVYTLQAYRQQLARRLTHGAEEIPINGICPGHMDTPLSIWPSDRSPYEAIHVTLSALSFDVIHEGNIFYWQNNKKFPEGHLFTGGSLRPLEWLIDKDKPSQEGKTFAEGMYMPINDDWRLRRRDADVGLFGRMKSFFL